MRLARCIALCFLVALLASIPLFGQAGTDGSFIGTVTDPTGGAVPGAEVVIKNLGTGLTKTASTDEIGSFAIGALPSGPYSVTVRAKGFKRWELARVELTVGDRNRLAPVLAVGDVSETISVEASAEVLQTEKASVETVVQ